MLHYYFSLAWKSFRSNFALTILMVLAISLGIGASMTTLTVFSILSSDPLPDKSSRLFFVKLDPQPAEGYYKGVSPPDQLTRLDAEALFRAKRANFQAIMAGGRLSVRPLRQDALAFSVDSRYTSPDFFRMFETPFLFGQPWSEPDENAAAQVVVISRELNEKLFDGANSVGRSIRLNGRDFAIRGILDTWRPAPKFYDLYVGKNGFGQSEEVYLPFSTAVALKFDSTGMINCFGEMPAGMSDFSLGAPCTWVQMWVQLDGKESVIAYQKLLDNYSSEQREAGRFARPNNWRLLDLPHYIEANKLVPSDVRLQMWLAFAFLAICLVNTSGLLLVKCSRRAAEIGTRRALGASRRSVFEQFLVESSFIGLLGGALGLAMAQLGLWFIRSRPFDYASLVHMNVGMLVVNFVLTIACSLLAGVFPAWRACLTPPALQLKSE